MKLAELQKKISDVLGVSVSQKELSFEIFVDTVSEILADGITLKVPRVGFFQKRHTSIKSDTGKIIFSPLPEDYSPNMRNLYLTIDTTEKHKNSLDFDSNIFSIGVGKPLLPLASDELPNTETSYAMLRKSIEERIRELIAESDQIPNFNIWDDYYKSPEEYDERTTDTDNLQTKLGELTSDLDFKEITIPKGALHDFFDSPLTDSRKDKGEKYEEEIQFGEIENDPLSEPINKQEPEFGFPDIAQQDNISEMFNYLDEQNVETDNSKEDASYVEKKDVIDQPEEIKQEGSHEETEQEIKVDQESKLEKSDEKKIEQEEVELERSEEAIVEEKVEQENDRTDYSELETGTSMDDSLGTLTVADLLDDTETKKIKRTHEEIKENPPEPDLTGKENSINEIVLEDDLKEKKVELWDFNSNETETLQHDKEGTNTNWLEEQSKELEEEITREPLGLEDEISEWNWGDELREEFGINKSALDDSRFSRETDHFENDNLELIDEPVESEKRFTKDLFRQLEKTLEREKIFGEEPARNRTSVLNESPKDNSKKVFLEFSGPPAKYEFVEEKAVEKERRMAITLINENEKTIENNLARPTITKPITKENEKYFGKTFLLIFSAFIILICVIVILLMKSNNPNPQETKQEVSSVKEPANNTAKVRSNENSGQASTKNSSQVSQKNISVTPINDELSNFPISATPPVPIKNEVDQSIINNQKGSTIKDAKVQSNKIANNKVQVNNSTETRIGKAVYTDGRTFTYQTSSWKNKQKAEQELKRIRALGLNASIVEAYLPQKGGTWYRIRIGSFKSAQEAENDMRKNNF
jgi:cell division protein FtsN